MVDAALQAMIEQTVKAWLAPVLVNSVTVEEGADYDDNDVLFVTLNLPPAAGRIPGERMLSVMTAVSEVVLERGDERVPYLRTFREGEPAPDDVDDLP